MLFYRDKNKVMLFHRDKNIVMLFHRKTKLSTNQQQTQIKYLHDISISIQLLEAGSHKNNVSTSIMDF